MRGACTQRYPFPSRCAQCVSQAYWDILHVVFTENQRTHVTIRYGPLLVSLAIVQTLPRQGVFITTCHLLRYLNIRHPPFLISDTSQCKSSPWARPLPDQAECQQEPCDSAEPGARSLCFRPQPANSGGSKQIGRKYVRPTSALYHNIQPFKDNELVNKCTDRRQISPINALRNTYKG
jgi:hypothetical protein